MTVTARSGTASAPAADEPAGPAGGRRGVAPMVWGWAMVLALASAVLLVDRFDRLPAYVASSAGGVQGVALLVGLVVRSGGRPLLPAVIGAGYAVAAVTTAQPLLLGGAAVGLGGVAAALAVMGTVPAVRFRRAVGEVVLACVLATVAGLGVAALGRGTHVDPVRFGYVVLAAALLACFALVYRLGAGFHGLGRRGYAVAAGAALLLAVVLAYSAAVGRWGSPQLVGGLHDVRAFVRVHAGAVPHPLETVLGVPALCWGTFMRARRRQGWWVCAFGAAATAPATTRFLLADVLARTTILSSVLGAIYSLVLGLALGLVVVRLDLALTGSRGRRARQDEEAGAHRPEPARFRPLQ